MVRSGELAGCSRFFVDTSRLARRSLADTAGANARFTSKARLRGEKIRKGLDLSSWEAASDLVAAWNASGTIGVVRPEVPTVAEAVDKFLADATSRNLQQSSLKKYRSLLLNRLVPYAKGQGRTRLIQLKVEALWDFRES